jgi:heme-degrading monooxygenase HmoA
MIARIWRGVTLASRSEEYLQYLEETGIPDYRDTPGNLGVQVLRRTEGNRAEFLLISLWESMEAITAFAGPDPERAVYYPRDDEFLLEKEPRVRHYDVVRGASPSR